MSLNKKTFLALLILILCFIGISIRIGTKELERFDSAVTTFIQLFQSDPMTKWMVFFSTIGSYKVQYVIFFALAAFYFFVRKNKFYMLLLFVNLFGVRLLNRMLKVLFERPRPDIEKLVDVSGLSFPSGHAMNSLGFYGFIAYIIYQELRERTFFAWIVPVVFSVIIFIIGLSRIYLGVHYPSDVLAGFLAGGAWILVCLLLLYSRRKMNT
ncbi:phosphatase PAP2 family protein [Calidifontibacillus erzurumensis]|uniref:Phosphatase PAP2 family protein n=1 Tax=Calidifontibacillus erzurumensis TaxID=2741433 RepID=A0A8J8KAC5_9BACI|nr:phosphatase PAP2 family protein [Calidifontibacillus erzurumensis]NSL50649.1 phosphatase PAP2 family protein [Calidifontibacillus erzurumensis]